MPRWVGSARAATGSPLRPSLCLSGTWGAVPCVGDQRGWPLARPRNDLVLSTSAHACRGTSVVKFLGGPKSHADFRLLGVPAAGRQDGLGPLPPPAAASQAWLVASVWTVSGSVSPGRLLDGTLTCTAGWASERPGRRVKTQTRQGPRFRRPEDLRFRPGPRSANAPSGGARALRGPCAGDGAS